MRTVQCFTRPRHRRASCIVSCVVNGVVSSVVIGIVVCARACSREALTQPIARRPEGHVRVTFTLSGDTECRFVRMTVRVMRARCFVRIMTARVMRVRRREGRVKGKARCEEQFIRHRTPRRFVAETNDSSCVERGHIAARGGGVREGAVSECRSVYVVQPHVVCGADVEIVRVTVEGTDFLVDCHRARRRNA